MISESNNAAPKRRYPFRPANLFVFAFASQSYVVMGAILGVCVLLAVSLFSVGLYWNERSARQYAEDNTTQYFYPTGEGVYKRSKIMGNEHILSFVDKYLATRHTWDRDNVDVHLKESKYITHKQLQDRESVKHAKTNKSTLDHVKEMTKKKRISQRISRVLDKLKHPMEKEPQCYGYTIRVAVNQNRSVYNKPHANEDFHMCFALIQVPSQKNEWGLEVGKWEKRCPALKPANNLDKCYETSK